MPNQHVLSRLAGIQDMLMGAYRAGRPLTSASKGQEREVFINSFLREVLTPPYRFGSGDITDDAGRRSGQVDVVVEYPFLPSLPIAADSPRLYLAEGVAAVVEVKSDIAAQWPEVAATVERITPLQRSVRGFIVMGEKPSPTIPIFAVGFTGWKTIETLEARVAETALTGILVIESGLYFGKHCKANGPWSLWGLISSLHTVISSLKATAVDPLVYATGVRPPVSTHIEAPGANSP